MILAAQIHGGIVRKLVTLMVVTLWVGTMGSAVEANVKQSKKLDRRPNQTESVKSPDQLIYEALNVSVCQKSIGGCFSPEGAVFTVTKMVGGLVCEKIQGSQIQYRCRLNQWKMNAEKIYHALDVKAKSPDQKDSLGGPGAVKRVGDLECAMSGSTFPVTYRCYLLGKPIPSGAVYDYQEPDTGDGKN